MCVHLALTSSGVNATGSVKRGDLKAKNHKDVPLPDMFSDYNSSMGGVDLHDINSFVSDKNHDEKALIFEIDFPYGGHLQGQWLASLSLLL